MRLTRVLCKSTFEFWFDGVKGENKFKLWVKALAHRQGWSRLGGLDCLVKKNEAKECWNKGFSTLCEVMQLLTNNRS
jgi:hypothetical protein